MLINSEFFYEFARLYMEVGIDQLASLDLKNEIKDNLTQVLAEYVKRQEETAESPRAQFETTLGQVIIVLPDFCM
jgi:nanoRNase/pAp phosphatase (c-di-AMP/oligoRNAs hydrolase)